MTKEQADKLAARTWANKHAADFVDEAVTLLGLSRQSGDPVTRQAYAMQALVNMELANYVKARQY